MSTGSILVVDDETKILNALGSALKGEGHEVVATSSPRDAQKLLAQRLFDVLIVDNLMPELTGLDLIRELVASAGPGDGGDADGLDGRMRELSAKHFGINTK